MSDEMQKNNDNTKVERKKKASQNEDVLYIERKVLKFFEEFIGDTYKEEIMEENEHKRNIQKNI